MSQAAARAVGQPGPGLSLVKPRRRPALPNDPAFLVDIDALCAALSVPKKWVLRLAREGKVPAVRIGISLRFRIDQVRERLLKMAEMNKFGEYPRR
jgi:excisionase family DNA binding protein